MKKWMFRVACLLAFAFSPAAFMAPPAQAVVATTKVTLTTSAWTDLGVGPILVSSAGRVVYAVSDTTPALVAEGFPIPAGDARTVNTASHVWARSLDGISAFIYVSPILASGGSGGGGSATITLGSTATGGYTAGQFLTSDGSVTQADGLLVSYPAAPNGPIVNFGGIPMNIGARGPPYELVWASDNTNGNGGYPLFYFGSNPPGIAMGNGVGIGWAADGQFAGPDITFARFAARTVGAFDTNVNTSSTSLRVYNTYTDNSNGEWGAFDWITTANVLTLGAQAAGTGTLRPLKLAGSNIQVPSLTSIGTQPTIAGAGGTCAVTTKVGGALAGTVVLSAICATTNTITWTGMPATANGYACDAVDRTTQTAGPFLESASTTTGFTLKVGATSSVAADVLQWKCIGY